MFHQAFVRRTGFKSARFDKILTGDIDVIVNENVVAAIRMVGKDNIGIVNLQKEMRSGFFDVVQNSTRRVIRALKKEAYFTGLYALYRTHRLETEDEESAKKIPHPLRHGRLERDAAFSLGLASRREATAPPHL